MMDSHIVNWAEFGRLVEKLISKIKASNHNYDLVIGIARGGIPPALEIANRLNLKIDFVNIKSYLNDRTKQKPKILSTLSEKVEGCRILIVDDIIDSGDTMETIMEWLNQQKPRSIETTALFVKPWSRFTPTYTVETVKEWIIFPWESESTH
ncbi:MAG: phosphoribosyltransferase domain-containing protein [Thaumarchaeota archaeon]|nr:phosphoribosyltransferase domain-containing protein [Nitrososphaerota archaeon]MCL5318181.1 phosphoribosyltransferase domain-containing protein [Nitrososphaerota archaeon]